MAYSHTEFLELYKNLEEIPIMFPTRKQLFCSHYLNYHEIKNISKSKLKIIANICLLFRPFAMVEIIGGDDDSINITLCVPDRGYYDGKWYLRKDGSITLDIEDEDDDIYGWYLNNAKNREECIEGKNYLKKLYNCLKADGIVVVESFEDIKFY